MMRVSLVIALSCVLASCFGDKSDDVMMQQLFENLEGPAADARDFCFRNASITLRELKVYATSPEIPESQLCFYKCFYEKIDIIDANGKILTNRLRTSPELEDMDDEELEELGECLGSVGNVKTCDDVRKTEDCFAQIST